MDDRTQLAAENDRLRYALGEIKQEYNIACEQDSATSFDRGRRAAWRDAATIAHKALQVADTKEAE